MEDFTLNIKLNKEDSRRLLVYSLLKRSGLTAVFMAAFLLLFVLMPTYWLAMGAVHLNFNLLLTLYVVSVWCVIYFYADRLKKSLYYGESEYRFSAEGLRISEKYRQTFIPKTELRGCEEAAEMFLILTKNGAAYQLPKRILTVSEGETIRRLFGNLLVKKGKLSDENFLGGRCDRFVFDDVNVILQTNFLADDSYIKAIANARFFTRYNFSVTAMLLFIIVGIGVSAMRSLAFPLFLGVSITVSSVIINLRRTKTALSELMTKNGGASVVFREKCFELVCGNKADRVYYDEITDVKLHKGAAEVKSSHGGNAFLPPTDEITRILEEKRYGKG